MHAQTILINLNVSVSIWLYTLCTIFNKIQKYISDNHVLKLSHIFWGLISSIFVSYLYGLIRHILCLICIGLYWNVTMLLVQHYVIKNGPLYGVSYLYAALLVSMTLSLTLYLWSNRFISLHILSLLLCVYFHWCINYQSTLSFIRRIISQPDTNFCPEYNLLTYFLLRKLEILLHPKCPTMGHLCQHRFL